MKITHVLRGSEWLPTFPLHVLIYQAMGWDQPIWVHLSVFLNPSGKGKMSKRHAGVKAIYVLDLKQMGYLPEGLLNWISLMGWSFDDHTEFFSIQELIEYFSLQKLNPSPAAVDHKKLDHFNGHHIRDLPTEDLAHRMRPFYETAGLVVDDAQLSQITPLVQERIRTLEEAVEISGFFFRDTVKPDPAQLIGKNMTPSESAKAIRQAYQVIEALPSMDIEPLETALRFLADEINLKAGQLFGILRVAVTGQRVSPPLIESMAYIGKVEVLARIERSIALLEAQAEVE
jgi:glutamyl-tRNA synthetase